MNIINIKNGSKGLLESPRSLSKSYRCVPRGPKTMGDPVLRSIKAHALNPLTMGNMPFFHIPKVDIMCRQNKTNNKRTSLFSHFSLSKAYKSNKPIRQRAFLHDILIIGDCFLQFLGFVDISATLNKSKANFVISATRQRQIGRTLEGLYHGISGDAETVG